MNNYFQGKQNSPYHISIGAVVRNNEGKICCHYFDEITHPTVGTLSNFYLLMRETIEPNEKIEECLARGLMEEFGIKATLNSFVGSIVSHFPVMVDSVDTGVVMEKTTLYFLCDFISIDESHRNSSEDDPEAKSKINWMDPQELIIKMKEQGKRLGREDMDESAVIERIVKL
jgi:hypothetical protein